MRRRSARALLATLRGAFAEAAANRAALTSQMTIMIVNDVVWIFFWVLFFRSVGTVRGWDGDTILVLLAVLTTAAGLALGLFANARRVGALAVDGELDSVLSLPVPPLGYLLLRRIETVHLGDVAFGVALFAATGDPTPARVAVFFGVVAASCAVTVGFLVLVGSLAFFSGRSEAGELGFHAILMTGAYPVDVFAGAAKVILYTVIPSAFIASVPAHLVEDFDVAEAAALATVAVVFVVLAWSTFTIGLRRYKSGNLWTHA